MPDVVPPPPPPAVAVRPLSTARLTPNLPHPHSLHDLTDPLASNPLPNMARSNVDNRHTHDVTSSSIASRALSVQSKLRHRRSPIIDESNDD
jgi:hypothetical protein